MHRIVLFLSLASLAAAEPVRLAHEPALSPDGKTLAFSWRGDIWTVPVAGGTATRLTVHEAVDSSPSFSPDGKQLAFTSDREGSKQVFVMPVTGGEPRQLTFHTEGYDVREWTPEGSGILTSIVRDFDWLRDSRSGRLAIVDVNLRKAEQVLFDDYAGDGSLSPDGRKVLFMREGESWWRQGYKGSRGGQLWLFNRDDASFKLLKRDGFENRTPLWKPDGKGFYYLCNRDGTLNLWQHDLASGKDAQLTRFKGDSVLFPTLSRDGSSLVFRSRFDLYRWSPGDKDPTRIDITAATDNDEPKVSRLLLDKATDVSFASSGLELAFISGGDVWVMDTELKEPRQVTSTPEEERSVLFSPDAKTLWFVSDSGGQTDLWSATRGSTSKPWWENTAFPLKRITNDPAVESRLRFTPDGKRLAYVKGLGDLILADADGANPKPLFSSWNAPSYEFSPDGRWIVYSQSDEFFNDDIWLQPTDASKPPFNLSRHPSNDFSPTWSPDGKMIAWTGRREIDEVDIFYVWLRAEDDETTRRERTLLKAREKFKKPVAPKAAPKKDGEQEPTPKPTPNEPPAKPTEPAKPAQPTDKPSPAAKPAPKEEPKTPVEIEDIHERIRRISIPNTAEGSLTWSPDSKKLAFTATVDGRRGLYSVELPDETKPKLIAATTISVASWLKADDQLVGLGEGRILSVSAKTGTTKTHLFRARQTVDNAARQRAVFDQCWQVMRDRYYDERLGNRDWNAVRAKYADMAATAPNMKGVMETVWLMLGELNGSHLGFTLSTSPTFANVWKEETAHLGLRFDPAHPGPGWKVRDVLPKGPASFKQSRIQPGEVLLKLDGRDLTPAMDPSEALNGPLDRDITLLVRAADGKERSVKLRPISYATARSLLYTKWIKDNRSAVEKLSGGTLGYLHISAMDDASFQKFQEQLYAAGAGKEGLVIDVRENGGGSTADHLLTSLTQPQHALTIPRGGDKPGYPQDRLIYATWTKPIVVLCNQNSYSNAEIFSHAIRHLQRGQVVGVPTAGGVISTGSAAIMDVGTLRLPFRGWYGIQTGLDMELNGAQPHHLLWPLPGDLPKGKDIQLEKAVQVLQQDVQKWKQRPQPKLLKASENKF